MNIKYCLVELELGKRHDILSYTVLSLLWPSADRISIEIALDYVEPTSPICFAIVPIKKMKTILQNTADLKRLTTPRQTSWL